MSYLFTVCQVGAEATLKKEIAREHPDLRFAYSRPGFITFKTESELSPSFELKAVFARAFGISLNKLGPKDGDLGERVQKVQAAAQEQKVDLIHVWERDQYSPGEEPQNYIAGELTSKAVQGLKVLGAKINEPATARQRVLDVVLVEENEWWIGFHQHGPGHSAYPGGRPEIQVPDEAPSRAYLKLEDAVLWSGAPFRKGDMAVEIGSAPGGASYALLQRGLSVVGIDPAQMDPRVLGVKRFHHIARPVADVLREELPETVHWLLLDMNVAPAVSMFAVDRLATRMKDSLLGVLLTVKLNQWATADQIPDMIQHVQAMGMVRVRATQLASNRQEFVIFGLSRKGLLRFQA